jgi:DNA modification methylase
LHRIYNEDSLQVMETMVDDTFNLVLLDPPYTDYRTHHRKDKENKLSQSLAQQSRDDQIGTVREAIRLLQPGSAFFFFTNWQEAWWFQQAFQPRGFLRNQIIWDKGNWTAGDLGGSLANTYEVIFLGCKGKGWTYRGSRIPDIWTPDSFPGYDLSRVGTNRIHATEKPVDLYKLIIEISTDEEDWILDPYMGSGASVIAALELNRNIIAYDVDEEYFHRAEERIKQWLEK